VISIGENRLHGRDGQHLAVAPLLGQKQIEAFGSLFRVLSFETIGLTQQPAEPHAWPGVGPNAPVILRVAGSPMRWTTAWDRLISAQLGWRHPPLQLVQLLPRLLEDLSNA